MSFAKSTPGLILECILHNNERMELPSPGDERKRIGILVVDGVRMLDVAGPAEVFIEATGAPGGYEVVFVSADGAEVKSSVGARIAVQGSVARAGRFDTVVIPGSDVSPPL